MIIEDRNNLCQLAHFGNLFAKNHQCNHDHKKDIEKSRIVKWLKTKSVNEEDMSLK